MSIDDNSINSVAVRPIVFLYTELAQYTIACLKALSESSEQQVFVVRWPVNKEAPFQFGEIPGVTFIERNALNDDQLVSRIKDIDPAIIFCSGWVDKAYLKACKHFKGKVPTVLTLDNHWVGSPKQRLATILSPFALMNKFSNAWVPGSPQVKYAEKLGFSSDKIKTGFYSADMDHFNGIYNTSFEAKKKKFPKRFLFVGRYIAVKGIDDLWEAFRHFAEVNKEWELWCLGSGELFDQRVEHERIKHYGFVQPSELAEIVQNSGVFVLSSHFEPWGVALQEFAACGFPIICTTEVGAAEQFAEHANNGFTYNSGNVEALTGLMMKMAEMDQKELVDMAQASHKIAQRITPKTWARTVQEFQE